MIFPSATLICHIVDPGQWVVATMRPSGSLIWQPHWQSREIVKPPRGAGVVGPGNEQCWHVIMSWYRWLSAKRSKMHWKYCNFALSHRYGKAFHIFPFVRRHDDVIKRKNFPRNWPFVWGIDRYPVNSHQNGQWCTALMFFFISAWTNGWVNNWDASDLRCHHVHYDITVMNPLVMMDSPHKGPMICFFNDLFVIILNKLFNKQLICKWFEVSRPSHDITVTSKALSVAEDEPSEPSSNKQTNEMSTFWPLSDNFFNG